MFAVGLAVCWPLVCDPVCGSTWPVTLLLITIALNLFNSKWAIAANQILGAVKVAVVITIFPLPDISNSNRPYYKSYTGDSLERCSTREATNFRGLNDRGYTSDRWRCRLSSGAFGGLFSALIMSLFSTGMEPVRFQQPSPPKDDHTLSIIALVGSGSFTTHEDELVQRKSIAFDILEWINISNDAGSCLCLTLDTFLA